MSKTYTNLCAAVASLAILALGGCGRHLPAAAAYRPASVAPAAAAHRSGPSLAELMVQATDALHRAYPNGSLYEVSGKRNEHPMVDAGDFDSWSFGALDDADHPKNTVYVEYRNGKFSAPKLKPGFDYGRQLSDPRGKLDLCDAIVALRTAGFVQDFRYVDLFSVINPAYKQPIFVFSGTTAVVTVNAETGEVVAHRPGWKPVPGM